jgi:hypothetical protein
MISDPPINLSFERDETTHFASSPEVDLGASVRAARGHPEIHATADRHKGKDIFAPTCESYIRTTVYRLPFLGQGSANRSRLLRTAKDGPLTRSATSSVDVTPRLTMEFALLPLHRGNPPIPVPRIPHISKERYDGGPWISYPSRNGKPLSAWDGKTFDLLEYHRSQRVNPTPLEELEPFIQTWLYFGLLAEFLCVNVSQLGIASSLVDEQEFKEIVNHIY